MLLQSQAVEELLENNPDGMFEALNGVLRSMIADTSGAVLDAGWALYWSLAVVITIWTGLKQAFGGRWEMWEYWRLIVALIIPLTMLQAYDRPLLLTATLPITLPGSADPLTFPELITAQGTWLAQELNDEGLERFWEYQRSLGYKLSDALLLSEADGVSGWNPLNWPAMWNSLMYAVQAQGLMLFVFLVGLMAAMIGFAQVVFAQVAIAICVVLGPVLIPWILLGPMAFLFWGWFRSLLTYGLYAAVSAAIFRVMLALLEGTTNRVLDAIDIGQVLALPLAERADAQAEASFWLLTMLACSVAAIVSFLKIPAVAAGLVSGQAGGESISGAMGLVGAAAMGAAKGGAALIKGGAGAAAAAKR